ncbi:MAG: PDZ domain-containing protein [Candidatus Omnitrophica bacterium]|nr:PDZ domain-containing protein [Candidatus Omnitrophota bacterium]
MPSLFLFFSNAFADTVVLKTDKELKGVVVEKHADRVILSTEKGEVPILLTGIKNIRYDDPAQNFFEAGKEFEARKKMGEALAYYEKALELNPHLEEAKDAAAGARNRFWAMATEGPVSEIEKQQALYDSWGQGRPIEDAIKSEALEETKALQKNLGVTLEKKGDWARLEFVDPRKDAALAGLKKNDRLVSIDGESLRYLGADAVRKKMLSPRFSSFMLEFERDCYVHKGGGDWGMRPDRMGLEFKWEYEGLKVKKVKKESAAAAAGIREDDFIVEVDGAATRYMPLKEVVQLVERSSEERTIFTIRRSALLTRR